MISGRFFPQEVHRFECSLPVFTNEIVKRDPAIGMYLFDAKRTLFSITSGHYFGAKRDLHLRPGPYIGVFDRNIWSFFSGKDGHQASSASSFFLCFDLRLDG